jgi:hypothetical protein
MNLLAVFNWGAATVQMCGYVTMTVHHGNVLLLTALSPALWTIRLTQEVHAWAVHLVARVRDWL